MEHYGGIYPNGTVHGTPCMTSSCVGLNPDVIEKIFEALTKDVDMPVALKRGTRVRKPTKMLVFLVAAKQPKSTLQVVIPSAALLL